VSLVVAGLGARAGDSGVWQVRGPRLAASDSARMMSMHLWEKDMGIIADFVADSDAYSPVFAQALALYNLAYQAGYGDSDSAVIHRVLKSLHHVSSDASPE